jgi:cysteinyl-tRNA synthetase
MIKLHNTLTKNKEEFTPIDPKNVRMYVCGPTVYDRAHIGNARAVVVFDVLYRLLRHEYGENHVTYARNITDVDDKINAAAKARGIEISELTTATTKMFHDDMAALNCLAPNIEPRATDHIEGMVKMCETLIKNGNAYAAEGHVLFSVASDPKYGHLSRRSRDEMIEGARVEIAPYKKDPMDFVLWKPSSSDEPGWDSPWGCGRPGWHIECSAMSTKYLGETFDIHGGGADLQFPHHENEIAQSCCAYPGSEFAKYWVHNGFLMVEGEKMSKSLGNFITVNQLLENNTHGEYIRCLLLSTNYNKPLNWTAQNLTAAHHTINGYYSTLRNYEVGSHEADSTIISEFLEDLRDDLNTAKSFAILHRLTTEINKESDSQIKGRLSQTLLDCSRLIGLLEKAPKDWFKNLEEENEKILGKESIENINNQITLRLTARATKNWAESDRIRNELAAHGIILKDNPDGTTSWERA